MVLIALVFVASGVMELRARFVGRTGGAEGGIQ